MNHKAARTSLSIRILTAIVLAMVAGLLVAGLRDGGVMAGGLLLGLVVLACYLLAPASYDVSGGRLTVVLHAGRRSFGRIVGCARVSDRQPFTVRLFGNGGLFAITGIFWNRRYGIFRIHATSARLQDMVLVQAERHTVLVTPEDPQAFVESARAPGPASPPGAEPAGPPPRGRVVGFQPHGPACLFFGLVCGCAFALLTSPDGLAEAAPPRPAPIVLSCAMPLVGQPVTLSVPGATGGTLKVSGPEGDAKEVRLGAAGHAGWTPLRYGRHVLRHGDVSAEVWVLARPMFFHWWDDRNDPRHATIVMTKRPEHWRSRGVTAVRWTVGEYASRTNGEYAHRRYVLPEQWLNDWYDGTKDWDGMAMDEMYCGPKEPSPALAEAVGLLRKKAGEDYVISVYTAGATKGFEAGARLLRENNAICLIESYYGDDRLFQKRWNDMKQYGLDKASIFAIGPGFKLRPDCHGPLTEAEVREEFAKVRRVAPESPGIAIYNAFSPADRASIQPGLDAACSQAIEDYFLKPVVCLAPTGEGGPGGYVAWNIGNEDAAGFLIQWLDEAGQPLGNDIPLPTLTPGASAAVTVPSAARFLRLKNPAGTVNIYPGGGLDVP